MIGMKLTLPVKLAPSAEQHAALLATMERFNQACDAIALVAFREGCANKIDLQKIVYYPTRERFGLAAQLTVRAISKVVEAYKRDKTICPRFRPHGAVPYDQRIMSWKGIEAVSLLTLAGRVAVPIRFGDYQAARLDRRQGQADLVYRDGVFFLYVTTDTPAPEPTEAEDFLGIDLGIVRLAVDSDGVVYSGEAVEKHRRVFAHRRRNLQRKGTRAAQRKLQKIRRKQARYQTDSNHVISKRVVAVARDTGRGIALEDLKHIRSRTTVRRRHRARHANWAFAQLGSFVLYKAETAGVPVVKVDPRYTSQTCPACEHVERANRLSQARFLCKRCGLDGLADAFAARVISARARAAVMPPTGVSDGPKVAQSEHRADAVAASRLL